MIMEYMSKRDDADKFYNTQKFMLIYIKGFSKLTVRDARDRKFGRPVRL